MNYNIETWYMILKSIDKILEQTDVQGDDTQQCD